MALLIPLRAVARLPPGGRDQSMDNVVRDCSRPDNLRFSVVEKRPDGFFHGQLVTASAAVPAAGFWLALGNLELVGSAFTVGFSMACCTLPLLLIQRLRLPLDRLPVLVASGAAAGPARVSVSGDLDGPRREPGRRPDPFGDEVD